MKKECVICGKSDNSYLFHTCRNNAGKEITVCDYCFQDIAGTKKIGGQWKEFILENREEYFIVKK